MTPPATSRIVTDPPFLPAVLDVVLLLLLLLELPPQPAMTIDASAVARSGNDLNNLRMGVLSVVNSTRASSSIDQLSAALGCSASCRPSPTRLKASTVSSRATPGKSMYHHAVSKIDVASESIAPQLAVGGCTPTPR